MPHSYTCINIHYVFGTENRFRIESIDTRKILNKYIAAICHKLECKVLSSYVMPDHVHILVSIAAKISVAELACKIKANSSRFMNEQGSGLGRFQWQSGYGAFSCSYSMLQTVRNYIQSQEEHHQKIDYDEEMKAFIARHME